MKNFYKILILALVILFTPVYFIHASDLGTLGNPLQVQFTQDPGDKVINSLEQQRQQIIQNANQHAILEQQQQQQQSLQSQLLYQQTAQNKVICSTVGATLKNGVCVPNNQICTDNFGENSTWLGSLDSSGRPNCGCSSGYQQNWDKTQCVANTATVEDQMCKKMYGINSYYANEDYHAGCGCKSGYKFSNDSITAECIPVDSIATQTSQPVSGAGTNVSETLKIQDKVPKASLVKKVVNAVKTDNDTVLTNSSSSNKNSLVESPVLSSSTPLPESKTPISKGLWQTVRSWFGF
ncbi:MAG: hypothetical protein WCO33_05205 [bacterium]